MARIYEINSGEPKARMLIEEVFPNCVEVYYIPPVEKLEQSKLDTDKPADFYKRKILLISGQDDFLTMYPLNTWPGHDNFLKQKYSKIASITLDGFGYETAETEAAVLEILEGLPAGFIKDWEFGLGLQKDYRFIIDAIENLDGVQDIVISKKEKTELSKVSQGRFTLNFYEFDAMRKGINKVANRAQSSARKVKNITAYNMLSFFLNLPQFPQKTLSTKNDSLLGMIAGGDAELSNKNQEEIIKIISKNKETFAKQKPEALLKLHSEIELVTLEQLIEKFEQMLTKNLREDRWQALFNDNPIILHMAFGYPIVQCQGQASVGGRKFSGAGDKVTDFLVKNGITNNAALIEIKTPDTKLLNKTVYRDSVYTPSPDLSGAINQALDQRYKLQKEIVMLKENTKMYDLETYAVHCILVIGKTPDHADQKKSFEFFRGNSKDVTIVTFDELLQKLKYLHGFLSSNEKETPPEIKGAKINSAPPSPISDDDLPF